MTLKIERFSGKHGTRIQLSGDLRSEQLDDVRTEIERSGPRATLDLNELDLVDVDAKSSDTRVRLMLTAAGSYFTLVVLLLIQALRGQPILRPDALTFGLFGAWALVTAICSWNSVNLVSVATTPETI